MWYFIIGMLAGMLISFLPFWMGHGAAEILHEWYGTIAAVESIEKSPRPLMKKIVLPPVVSPEYTILLRGDGTLQARQDAVDRIIAASGNGKYFCAYRKAGEEIEFFNVQGTPFWKITSREYPWLSYNGELIVLLKSDHSELRLFDYHGNQLGTGPIPGRFATVICFAPEGNRGGAGFFDGSYCFFDGKGSMTVQGRTPADTIVKSMAICPSGEYQAVHYGNGSGDSVRIIRTSTKKEHEAKLSRVHVTKIPMHISNDGTLAVIDFNEIRIVSRRGKTRRALRVPPVKPGTATIGRSGPLYAAAFTGTDGEAHLMLFFEDGRRFFERTYASEAFLNASIGRDFILVRGSQGLYCYSFHL
jgi:hypothetical protein